MSRRRQAALVGACVLAALTMVVVRLRLDSGAALRRGDEAAARGEMDEAIRRWGHAARLYVPGSASVATALDCLDDAAASAERAGDFTSARHALESLRGALLGARSLYTPFASRLPDVERRLASLAMRVELRPGAVPEAWHLARLAERPGPSLAWSVLALLGFATWIGAAVGFILRGLDASLRLRRGPALGCALAFLGGFALFLTALRLA